MPGGQAVLKFLGTLLVLGSAAGWWLRRRKEMWLPVRIGRALTEDLAVLRFQIEVCRTPLPRILDEFTGLGKSWFWGPLAEQLAREAGPPAVCWRDAAVGLPGELGRFLVPVGRMLDGGGEALARAVEETREELAGFLREETVRLTAQGRVNAALCFGGAGLVVLVLL